VNSLRPAALIVVSYNSGSLLEENLVGSGLAGVASIVVVDNSTDPEEAALISRLAAAEGWRLIVSGGNIGFGAAVNRGADLALENGAEVLLLLNPDAMLAPESARTLIERASPDRIIAPKVLDSRGGIWFGGGYLDPARGIVRHALGARDWLTGACLAIDADAWRSLGGFDETYFLYWEDVDLSDRWRRLGGRLEVLEDTVAVHAVGGTQTGAHEGKSRAYLYYNSRNRLIFALTGQPLRRWVSVLLRTPAYSWRLCRRANPRSVRDWARATSSVVTGAVSGFRVVRSRRSLVGSTGG
jgi:GT2 family glycosyltransferase